MNRFSTSCWATAPASEQEAPRLLTTETGRVMKWLFRYDRQPNQPQAQEAEAHPASALRASRLLIGNPYVLLEELGRGGMAIVCLVLDSPQAHPSY